MGSGSPTCPHTRPSFSRLNTSGPSSTSHSPTSTSRRLLISSTSSPSAVAFSITISSNPAQTSTGGPSQTSRPNQPETVLDDEWSTIRRFLSAAPCCRGRSSTVIVRPLGSGLLLSSVIGSPRGNRFQTPGFSAQLFQARHQPLAVGPVALIQLGQETMFDLPHCVARVGVAGAPAPTPSGVR